MAKKLKEFFIRSPLTLTNHKRFDTPHAWEARFSKNDEVNFTLEIKNSLIFQLKGLNIAPPLH
jgi:hypothetical protein